MVTMGEELLTEMQLAKRLGISRWTVRRWRINNRLPHIGEHRRFLYRLEAVQEWLVEEEAKNLSGVNNKKIKGGFKNEK